MAQEQEKTDTLGQHPWKETTPVSPKIANWSLYIHGGFNAFDGDFTSEKKHEVNAPVAGLGFEYNFNPTWGIGGEYVFRHYGVQGNGKGQTVDGALLSGHSHQVNAYITFDIFNVWRPMNRKKLFALNLMVGGGYLWYKNSTYYPNTYKTLSDGVTLRQPLTFRQNTANEEPQSMDKYKSDAVFFGGAQFEFNVCRAISLGIRAVYNYACHDEIDGRVRGNNNDGAFDVSAILRWKLEARKKTHVRNICSYNILDKMVAEQAEETHQVQKDTVVFYHRDTIVSIVRVSQELPEDYMYVYFENNSSVIDNQGLVTIQQAANRMSRDENLCAIVIGYCDNTGTTQYNKSLGIERANKVANELMEEYGYSEDRVLAVGRGIIRGKRSTGSYMPNRRAEIQFMDKARFEAEKVKFIEEQEEVTTLRGTGKEVIVEDNTTLSKLAREYYNNTHCWVYIYLANDDVLKNPNQLEEGMTIRIPELNAKQKGITRERAAELYREMK